MPHNHSTHLRINLLPEDRRAALARADAYQIASRIAVGIFILTIVAGGLLVPTYLFLGTREVQLRTTVAAFEHTEVGTNESAASRRLQQLLGNVQAITALQKSFAMSTLLRSMLTIPQEGVSIRSLQYTQQKGAVPGVLLVSGVASSRAALHNYQSALASAPFAQAATLPVGTYAKDADIPFAITITLAP